MSDFASARGPTGRVCARTRRRRRLAESNGPGGEGSAANSQHLTDRIAGRFRFNRRKIQKALPEFVGMNYRASVGSSWPGPDRIARDHGNVHFTTALPSPSVIGPATGPKIVDGASPGTSVREETHGYRGAGKSLIPMSGERWPTVCFVQTEGRFPRSPGGVI